MGESMKVGIAITTKNRPEVCRETFAILNDLRPKDSFIGVVDDGSAVPPFGFSNNYMSQYRFNYSHGVGYAKNKCLEMLHNAGCTHFFLFDDDCRPLVDKWWEPYVNSRLAHACWTFDRKLISEVRDVWPVKDHDVYEKPNGCMLYFTRECIDKAGGWDLDFKGFGYEHVSLSDRIYNLGLTPARYIDVPNSKGLFELANVPSSFTSKDRDMIPTNLHLYQQKYYSKEFKPFK